MIDVNKLESKKLITKEAILSHIDDYNIYRYYCGDFQIGRAFISPLREERTPSFGIFIGESNELCFNDFKVGGGDFIKLVQLKFGLTYFEALSKIAYDFNIHENYKCKKPKKSTKKHKFKLTDKEEALRKVVSFNLQKKSRNWKIQDFKFWKQFSITYTTLKKYNVQPVEYIFLNDKVIKADEYAYCFIEFKDGVETYKIYQPYNDKYKWINNHNDSVWQGWTQLPDFGNKLIITKSLKDVMSICELTNYPAISLQTESIKPKNKIVDQLKSRFENIVILYDNDFDSKINWGRQFSKKLSEILYLPTIEIEDQYKSKDFSDLVKNHGIVNATSELTRLMEMRDVPF